MQAQQSGTSPPVILGGMAAPSPLTSANAPSSNMLSRRPYLYIGQLSPQVNEMTLREIFSACGVVISAKVVADRSVQFPGALNYGFVEYGDIRSAEQALKTLNGRTIFDSEIRVDWAASSLNHGDNTASGPVKENTSHHFHVFVGDLAPEVNDSMLQQAFQSFLTLSEARVMWDVTSGKSRGYGFVAFRDRSDAEQAIATMNGEWLGSRAIRVNWANQKGGPSNAMQPTSGQQHSMQHLIAQNSASPVAAALGGMAVLGLGTSSMPPTGGASSGTPITYEQAVQSSAPHNTTVYVGNIPPFATQNDLIPLFSQYGYIIEIRMQADRGFAFIKLDTHENAASAIVNLAGQVACGRPIKCGWGKDRNESALFNSLRQGGPLSGYGSIAPPQAIYGMPQFGFPGGFTAFPSHTGGGQVQGSQMAPALDAGLMQQLQTAQLQAAHAHAQTMQQQPQQLQHSLSIQQQAGVSDGTLLGAQQQHQQQQQDVRSPASNFASYQTN